MSKPLLSILIPTVTGRERELDVLLKELTYQTEHTKVSLFEDKGNMVTRCYGLLSNVEVVVYRDDKTITIGEKRERLYKLAIGKYSVQWDDDDDIHTEGVKMILNATNDDPDCITYEEHIDIDGNIMRSNHSCLYGDWEGNGSKLLFDGFHFHRTPFFKSVIKTEIAKSIPVPYVRFGEDHLWAQALKPHLKTEIHLDTQIYRYIHRSSNPIERYGLDK